MKIGNSADIYEDTGLRDLIHEMQISDYFKDKNYGNTDVELFFVINCLYFNAKCRKRYDSKANVLSWDIILDYDTVKKATLKEKKIILANSVINSFDILDKYKKLHLNKEEIKAEVKKYFLQLKWLDPKLSIV